jgi:hypothetical protein
MDEKTAKEIAKQLKRIADAMESTNKRETLSEKRKAKLESLEIREIRKTNVQSNSEKE